MLHAFRNLALQFLWTNMEGSSLPQDQDLFAWFQQKRKTDPTLIFPYLVEDSEKISQFYILRADVNDSDLAVLECREIKILRADVNDSDLAVLECREIKNEKRGLPFVKLPGSQSGAIGPVIKRTLDAKKNAGPSAKIQVTTMKGFHKLAEQNAAYSAYFQTVLDTFERPRLQYDQKIFGPETDKNAYALAIEKIPDKKTVLLAFQDRDGQLPGENQSYRGYLQESLATAKYSTGQASPKSSKRCSLCDRENVTVYANAMRGAGINFGNVDRSGAFPAIKESNAWKSYALCVDCADLLYIYQNHVAQHFRTDIAGSKALVVPHLQGKRGTDFFTKMKEFVKRKEDKKENELVGSEERVLHKLKDDQAVATIDILWAKFGQNIEKLHGLITDVLRSRLRQLADINYQFTKYECLLFPAHPLIQSYSLDLTFLGQLLKKPGGKKAQRANDSERLFQLRREMAEVIYHKERRLPARFWDEVLDTARWYIKEVTKADNSYGLLYEGYSEKKQTAYWTLAGWVRHLAQFLVYLTQVEVLAMTEKMYEPECGSLKPYFGKDSRIDTPEKAFAFLLGVLYGRLLYLQGGKGVNVSANALTWLKRLNLTGSDLPELYNKVREKLLAYEAEKSAAVREVIVELSKVGILIGSNIQLNQVETCYFLLLGQSLSTTIFPRKKVE